MMKIEIKKSAGSNEVILSGEAIIDNAAAIKSRLEPLLKEGSLVINLDQVSRADLSFIQIIYSLAVEYQKSKGELSVVCSNPKNAVVEVAYKLGFSNQTILSSLLNLKEE